MMKPRTNSLIPLETSNRSVIVRSSVKMLSESDVRSLVKILKESLPPNQKLIRTTIQRVDKTKDGKKIIFGLINTFCPLDKINFLLEFQGQMKREGTFASLFVNGRKIIRK